MIKYAQLLKKRTKKKCGRGKHSTGLLTVTAITQIAMQNWKQRHTLRHEYNEKDTLMACYIQMSLISNKAVLLLFVEVKEEAHSRLL